MKKIGLIVATLVFALAGSVRAEVTIAQYEEWMKREKTTMTIHVGTLGDAFSYANIELEYRGQQPLYCPPPKLPMINETYVAILNDQLKEMRAMKASSLEEHPVPLILLQGLIRTLPCEKQ